MKEKEWGFWLILAIVAGALYEAGKSLEDTSGVTAPASSANDVTPTEQIKQTVQRTGLDTSKYDDIILSVSQTFGVPVEWIKAVIGKESTFRENPPVRPGDESYGLMQLIPATARGLGFTGSIPGDLLIPSTNIYLGTALLHQWRATLGEDFAAVYSAYNSGNPRSYLTNPQVAENVQKAQAWLDYFTAV